VVLDGADVSECFPYAFRLRTCPSAYLTPIRQSLYIKRELMDDGQSFGPLRHLPPPFRRWLGVPNNVFSLGFSIPICKITRVSPATKTKDFNRDIIDPELTAGDRARGLYSVDYPFENEADYYADLQTSRFGITTKRAGWDCMRHYEIMANGAVLAFRQLDRKPMTSAPHGLTTDNCLIYQDRADLLAQIAGMTPEKYTAILEASGRWIDQQTTVARAVEFLELYRRYRTAF
jgi:hypothetical protein